MGYMYTSFKELIMKINIKLQLKILNQVIIYSHRISVREWLHHDC